MRISKGLLAGGLVALTALVWLWAYGCDKRPTEPEPEPPKDYVAYFYDAMSNEGNWYFAYHPLTNNIDSFYLPYESTPVISADGKKMYVRDGAHDAIAVVELDTFTVVDQLPYGAPLAVSPDNQLIAVYSDGLYILRTSDYSLVFHDTALGGRGVFSNNSISFYGIARERGTYKLDLSDTLFSLTIKTFEGAVRHIVPSLDETKWFLYMAISSQSDHLFAVYDFEIDSIIFAEHLWPGLGELEVTPDGKYVFYTNPGGMLYEAGPPWITVYDVEKNQIFTRISTVSVLDEPYDIGVPVGFLSVTPDGRWLVAMVKGYPYVLTVDINSMNIVNYRILDGPKWLDGLACQNGL